jgi:hypothetical protein
MSFADKWLNYLDRRKEDWVRYIVVRGKRPENMTHTEIRINIGGEVEQSYYTPREVIEGLGGVPDKIGIEPIDVESVEVETSDGFTFVISKGKDNEKPKIKLKYGDHSGSGIAFEKERKIIEKAKKLGYDVVDFHISDI